VKIISGGQTGVDTGALLAAESYGMPWQAYLPQGLRRESPMPEWMRKGAIELLGVTDYAQRTGRCIELCDAVLIIAPTLTTPGTKLTLGLARSAAKQIWWHEPMSGVDTLSIHHWLKQQQNWLGRELVLMVAGPRESKWRGAEAMAKRVVMANLIAL